ncbi:hypothetical protein [Cohnella sp. GbtcB17]|uniref:hypothetical protein n=1 Tax=Cohnella sp. GbtcB17 TaxID=2824762 RepID=UPI001C2F61B3|nr:hypothetical protein [Cohnella sp. GbtcB17]
MVDLPMLLHKKGLQERGAAFERLTILLAAGNRGMDDEGYKAYYERLSKSLAEEDDNQFDRAALDKLRRRMTEG